MKKNKIDIVKAWLNKADRDLIVANREINLDKPLTDIICFHAQQAVEKMMKAYLIFLEVEFHKTHDIEDLVVQAAKKDLEIIKLKDKGAELTPYAVESRYPEFSEPSLSDTKIVLEIAKEFKDYINNYIKNKTIKEK